MADFTFVTDHVATGAAIADESDVNQLARAGVSHCIDCRDDFDDAALLGAHPEIAYLWNGTPDDGQTKPAEWFGKSLAFALPALCWTGSGTRPKVYCHCAAGVNRGPSTAFAILVALDFMAVMAEAQIRDRRPQVGLAYRDNALNALTALGYL